MRRLLKRAEPHWQRAQNHIEHLFGAHDTAALHAALERFDHVLRTSGESE